MYEDETVGFLQTDMDGSGYIDELELREYIYAMKKEGALKRGADIKVRAARLDSLWWAWVLPRHTYRIP